MRLWKAPGVLGVGGFYRLVFCFHSAARRCASAICWAVIFRARTALPSATHWRGRTVARAPAPLPSAARECLLVLGAASLPESDPDPAGAATPAPARGRRISGCARHAPASHRLPPIPAEIPETSCPAG